MEDAQHKGSTLVDILRVLESIERKLDKQNERLEQLKPPLTTTDNLETPRGINIEEDKSPLENSYVPEAGGKELSASRISLISGQNGSNQGVFEDTDILAHPEGQPLGTSKIPYSCWNSGQQDREVDIRFQEMLQKYLGDYWEIPWDNRFPLNIIKNISKIASEYGDPQMATQMKQVHDLENRLARFIRFDTTLRSHKGNDFLVIDYDPANNTRLYRLREKAVGEELMVLPDGHGSAPWSRLM